MTEQWKQIPGFEHYEISDRMRLRALARGFRKGFYMATTNLNRYGYPCTALRDANGKRSWHTLHRLSAITFLDNPENKPEVNHRFFDKLDWRPTELEWATSSENHAHAYANGKHALNLHRDPLTGRMMAVAT